MATKNRIEGIIKNIEFKILQSKRNIKKLYKDRQDKETQIDIEEYDLQQYKYILRLLNENIKGVK